MSRRMALAAVLLAGAMTSPAFAQDRCADGMTPYNGKINTIAGKLPTEPLTFGDLKANGVCLRMMTTCFTWGRPFTMPFESHILYFCPQTLRAYFPAAQVPACVRRQWYGHFRREQASEIVAVGVGFGNHHDVLA